MVRHKNTIKNRREIIRKLRRDIVKASYLAGACHIGSALSCVEIIYDIYCKMRPKDIFVFSKASGAAALYAVLAEWDYFNHNVIHLYLQMYPLASRRVPGVAVDSGSLGHGLPQALGMALADRTRNIYVLLSDGELEEGTTWECLLFKKKHKLNNVKIYVDHNGFQACGKVKDILSIPWDFLKKQGVKVVKTIKGKGVDFMENDNRWHYFNLDEETYAKAIRQLAD